jgi:deoxyribodipyrimidine photo-lyase
MYDDLKFENNKSHFARWTEGMTGYPIVDAGMRQLNTTGWMHNRVRMIVASFLTKHLLIDYRWGENYFMKMLLDGDLAPNNGGWQWAASTGCDPQPYFRIFNPWLQSEKFDPDGTYIQHFVSELRGVSPKAFHDPNLDRSKNGYPDPIVDHASSRARAIEVYKNHRSMGY